jgi:hypothetical protein
MGVKAIARRLGVARNTVRTALRSAGPSSCERQRKDSIVDGVEPQILELLRDRPDMPATVVAERIGWERSIRVLRERVAELRPLFVPPDPCQPRPALCLSAIGDGGLDWNLRSFRVMSSADACPPVWGEKRSTPRQCCDAKPGRWRGEPLVRGSRRTP